MSLTLSTWRLLGLSVSATYIALGTFALSAPSAAATAFGIYPGSTSTSSTTTKSPSPPTSHEISSEIQTSMRLLGARDFSIGLALGLLAWDFRLRETGTVILSGMVLCAADIVEIFRRKGVAWGVSFTGGAAIWAVIGVGLVSL